MTKTRNIIHPDKGMYTDLAEKYSFEMPGYANPTNDALRAVVLDTQHTASVRPLNAVSSLGYSPYEYYRHSALQTFTSASYTQVKIDGGFTTISGELATWNKTTSVFKPEKLGAVYLLRFEGEILPVGGNPIFHVDFLVSGSDPESTTERFRHKQTIEVQVRNVPPHQHLHGVFMVFTDQTLLLSGGIFIATSTAQTVTITTASVMIASI